MDFFDLEQRSRIAQGSFVASLNLENLLLAEQNPEYKAILNEADLVLADGEFIVLVVNSLLKKRLALVRTLHKVAGIDLAEAFIEDKSKKIAILGSKATVIARLQEKYSEQIVFAHHGFFSLDQSEEISKKIGASGAEVLLVGMGAPRQEKFIYDNKKYFPKTTALALGGALDVLAGATSRAPRWMIKMKLEWLFRILQEPFRLKRIFVRVTRFCSLIASKYFYRG